MTGLNVQVDVPSRTPLVQALAWHLTTNPYDDQGGYTISDPLVLSKTNPLAISMTRKTEIMNVC